MTVSLQYVPSTECGFKVVCLGNAGCGKTSLLKVLAGGVFDDNELSSVSAAMVYWHPNEHMKIQVWDTAGQEKFSALVPMYTRNSDIIIICYSIPEFKEGGAEKTINPWVELVSNQVAKRDDTSIIYVATKKDLSDESVELYPETEIMTSAKTREGIVDLSTKLITILNEKDFHAESRESTLAECHHEPEKRCC